MAVSVAGVSAVLSCSSTGSTARQPSACDAAAVPMGDTIALGVPLPVLSFASDEVDGDVVAVQSMAMPCSAESRLVVLRVVAGWCGTCRWHASHTPQIVPGDVADRVSLVDVVLANDDNQLASSGDLASWRAHGDGMVPALADPTFALSPLFPPRSALPLYALVDARTMVPEVVLSNPDPDSLTNSLRQTLASLDGQSPAAASPVVLQDGRFTSDEWDMIKDMVLVQPPPPDPTNRVADDPKCCSARSRALREHGPFTPGRRLSKLSQP